MHDEVTVDSFYEKVFALVLAICVVFTAPLMAQADGAGIFNANFVACLSCRWWKYSQSGERHSNKKI